MRFQLAAFADESSNAFSGQIDALKRNGFQHLEIRNVGERNVTKLTLQEAKELDHVLRDNGLSVSSIGSPIGKIDIDGDFNTHLDLYKHTLDLAGVFGAEQIRLFSFFMPKNQDPDNFKNLVLERMAIFAQLARSHGVTACHENEKGIYGDVASRCLNIHTAVPELCAVFDPANFVQCGQDTLEAWELLHTYVEYMHIKDSLSDGRIVPPGAGDGNVAELIRRYHAQGGKVLSLEPHLAKFVGLSDLEREGEESVIGTITFGSSEEAFDHAANTLKDILEGL